MPNPDAYEQSILDWRRARLARLTAPDSWLSLIGKVPLERGVQRVGSAESCEVQLPADKAPALLGELIHDDAGIAFRPAPGVTVGVERAGARSSEAVGEAIALRSDAQGAPDRLVFGSLRIEIMQRGSTFAARVRDLESAARHAFAGIEYFPIRPELCVRARLVPYRPEKTIELLYDSGDPEPYRSPGAAVWNWQGVEYRLDPVFDGPRPRLYVLFRDATFRDSTYGAGRFLYAPLPANGEVILDFNQAFNPPCAFTPFAACPLTPQQNRLPVRIEAGEKRPAH
jgi:uncharacterized protein (DUF1684 family)